MPLYAPKIQSIFLFPWATMLYRPDAHLPSPISTALRPCLTVLKGRSGDYPSTGLLFDLVDGRHHWSLLVLSSSASSSSPVGDSAWGSKCYLQTKHEHSKEDAHRNASMGGGWGIDGRLLVHRPSWRSSWRPTPANLRHSVS